MNLSWTWYIPGMRNVHEALDLYEEKQFKELRERGIKFWDVNHKRWCLFPDNFKEQLYLQGVLQDAKPKPKPLLVPQQGELF